MILASLAFLAAFQQQPAAQAPAAAPSPVKKVAISPANPVLTVGDTVRLVAQALGEDGKPVPDAQIRFQKFGGHFEGAVDSTGLVTAGSTGTLGVAVVALVPGSKPYIERLPIRMVAGPATRIEIQVREPPVEHFLMYAQLTQWLNTGGRTPADASARRPMRRRALHPPCAAPRRRLRASRRWSSHRRPARRGCGTS